MEALAFGRRTLVYLFPYHPYYFLLGIHPFSEIFNAHTSDLRLTARVIFGMGHAK